MYRVSWAAAVDLQHASRSSVLSMCQPCCWRTSVESGERFGAAEERAQERSLCPLPKVCTEQCGRSAVQKKRCSHTALYFVTFVLQQIRECPGQQQDVSVWGQNWWSKQEEGHQWASGLSLDTGMTLSSTTTAFVQRPMRCLFVLNI